MFRYFPQKSAIFFVTYSIKKNAKDMKNKIRSIDPEKSKNPRLLKVKKQGKNPCKHDPIVLNEDFRRVECEKCGAILDPYTVMLKYAMVEQNMYERANYYQKEIAKLQKEIAKLYEERNRLWEEKRTGRMNMSY